MSLSRGAARKLGRMRSEWLRFCETRGNGRKMWW